MENQKQRKDVQERLATEEGKRKYNQRKIDVEPVFGQIKHNRQFQQFSLKGLSKNTVDWGLICTSRNLIKWAAHRKREQKIVE